MSTGGTDEELDAQVKALEGALELHRDAAHDAEQHAVAYPTVETWPEIAAVHREIVTDYVEEVRQLRAEIQLIPQQRRAQ